MKHKNSILWIASGNRAKTQELIDFARKFFPEFSAVQAREPRNVVESEPTFEGNAHLKASALTQELLAEDHQDFSVLSDDSGLCIDLLDGRPGVYSGRYSGDGANSKGNLEKVLHELSEISFDMKKRTGQYHCSLYLVFVRNGAVQKEFGAKGSRKGIIALAQKGANGYAYDSIFLDPETLLSYAEISYEEKQTGSHRCRAFVELKTKVAGAL